ncbi:MAG: NahK/ErcS family hybrid sensor histidine kinase/response regulator [Alphaproteobacteria bacterium]
MPIDVPVDRNPAESVAARTPDAGRVAEPASTFTEILPTPPPARRFPLQVLMIAIPLTIMMLGLFAGATSYIWSAYRTFQRLQSIDLPLGRLSDALVYESKTMQLVVEAAVGSGDPAWEDRYNRSAGRFDTALKNARSLAPEAFTGTDVQRLAVAERQLRTLDKQIFALLRAGRRDEAQTEWRSAFFKARYIARMAVIDSLLNALDRYARTALDKRYSQAYRDTAIAAASFTVLFVAWIVILRMLGQSMAEAAETAEALRRERDFAESMVENARVIVLLLDDDGRIVRFNPYFAELSGYRLSRVRGRRWSDVFLPHEARRRSGLRRNAEDAEERHGEISPIITRDGRTREIAWYDKILRDENGVACGLLAIGQDITERNQAESQRLAREAAEEANLAKSKFLAAASHDLRQPLQAMRMFVAALAVRTREAENREIIGHIEDAMESTDGLLNALLDISKLDAGVLKPEIVDFAIGELLTRLAAGFRPQAEAKGVDLRLARCGVAVRSDPALLEDMLRNLLANAVRYTERGRILLGCRRRGDRLRIEVWDTGDGIPPDQREAIFEEFHQLGNPERDRTRGLGLGLAIVDRMSRLLAHRVTLDSTPGRGSVFAIEVPRAVVAAQPGIRVSAAPAVDLADRFVVIVDDEPEQLAGLRLVLEGWGCRVVAATTAEQASSRLSATAAPDLIVADFRLRGNVTGAVAIERIRARVGRRVPGLILTGDTEPARLREARVSGYELLHKPVDPDALRAAIASILLCDAETARSVAQA